MIVGIVRETFPGEKRVALVPANIPQLIKLGLEILLESGAGKEAGYPDSAYEAKGAKIVTGRSEIFSTAEVILYVRGLGANPDAGKPDLDLMKSGQALVGMFDPLSAPDSVKSLAAKGVNAYAMELMPRITRAQSMDTLSSMATVAGYRSVLMAAEWAPVWRGCRR